MNHKKFLGVSMLVSAVIISGGLASSAAAQTNTQSVSEISYPIAELGNCADKAACKTYCDVSENLDACLSFAEKKNMMPKDQIDAAKNFKKAGMIGPGGCKGKTECDNYCGDKARLDECISFAEKNNLMPAEQLKEAKQVQAAIVRGIKAPACNGKKACDAYCSSAEHMEECITFATEAGIMDQEKQEKSKKVLTAIKQGIKPPACNGKEECDKYCGDSSHIEECLAFGRAAGIMTPQEQERGQKTLDAIKQGINPPNCKGEQECQVYCSEPSHLEECIKFGEATGMITKERASMIRQTGGKKPEGGGFGQGPGEGTGPGEGAGQGKGGPGAGEGPGNGAGQGGGSGGQGQGLSPTKCSQDCALTGNNCLASFDAESKACTTSGESCRRSCEKQYENISDDETRMSEQRNCFATQCNPIEISCHNAVEAKQSACTTTKDGCITQCQSKPTQPNQPIQPTQPGQPGQQPTQPTKPTKPSQPNQSGQPNQPRQPGGAGGPNQGEGFNQGSGKGGKQNQGVNPNPVKCIEDCEYVGKICLGEQGEIDRDCASQGSYCRQVSCETVDAEGNRSTAEVMRACASRCEQVENTCHAGVVARSSTCTTTKDFCVMECQKASKPSKPTQPNQPTQPGQPAKPTEPTKPAEPTRPPQPTIVGTCGDGICGITEQVNPLLCPQDCTRPAPPIQPQPPTKPQPPI